MREIPEFFYFCLLNVFPHTSLFHYFKLLGVEARLFEESNRIMLMCARRAETQLMGHGVCEGVEWGEQG